MPPIEIKQKTCRQKVEKKSISETVVEVSENAVRINQSDEALNQLSVEERIQNHEPPSIKKQLTSNTKHPSFSSLRLEQNNLYRILFIL